MKVKSFVIKCVLIDFFLYFCTQNNYSYNLLYLFIYI